MADLPESKAWAKGIYQLETSDPVLGGPEGIANQQAKQLASRTRWLKIKVDAFIDGTLSVAKAVKLATTRTISISGAATGSVSFDGSANTDISLILRNSGVAPGTYTKLQVDAKGIVTAGSTPTRLSDHGIAFATQYEAETGSDTNKPMNALRVLQAITAKVVQATASAPGIVRIATQIMVKAGTDNRTMVTPQTLAGMFPFRGLKAYSWSGVFTWDVPPGVTKAWVEVIAGGGGGARSSSLPGPSGGSGGGIAKKLFDLTDITSVIVTVGAGGVGGSVDGSTGTNGGTSSFGTTLWATGGEGGFINGKAPQGGSGVGGDEIGTLGQGGLPVGTGNNKYFHGGAGGGGVSAAAGIDAQKPRSPGQGGGGRSGGPAPDGADGQITIQW